MTGAWKSRNSVKLSQKFEVLEKIITKCFKCEHSLNSSPVPNSAISSEGIIFPVLQLPGRDLLSFCSAR